jgi:hypothetical protein
MIYPKSKKEITEVVLAELPVDSTWHEMPLDKVVFRWWVTGRGGFGLRLSDEGASAFAQANITFYQFPVGKIWGNDPKALKPELITQELSKKIKCPYYLSVNTEDKVRIPIIKIYDHKIAMMVTLYGTLREYLDSVN